MRVQNLNHGNQGLIATMVTDVENQLSCKPISCGSSSDIKNNKGIGGLQVDLTGFVCLPDKFAVVTEEH